MSEPNPQRTDARAADPLDPEEVKRRVAALQELAILDTQAEPEFDDLVEIAAAICEVPIGVISFMSENRQWFKARIGTELLEIPLNYGLCFHTMRVGELVIVEDAKLDRRFRDLPMVAREKGTRFYAGVPLFYGSGPLVGTLCVLDGHPKQLTRSQTSTLRVLARQVEGRLELRTKRRRLQEALAEAEEVKRKLALSEGMFRSFMNNGPFHAMVKSVDGCYLYGNQRMVEHLGLTEDQFVGKSEIDVLPEVETLRHRKHDRETLRSGKLSIREENHLNRKGVKQRLRIYKFPCVSVDGEQALGTIFQDVSVEVEQTRALESSQRELQLANYRLQQLAQTDGLTGLPNRRTFDERLRLEWTRAHQQQLPLAVILLDIDHFKQRNDTYGHAAGDLVLQQLSGLLRTGLRDKDLFARYGGEEFALILPNTNDTEAKEVAERLLTGVRNAAWEYEPVTVSFGVAGLDCGPKSTPQAPEELIGCADQALYTAKREGRNQVVLHEESPQPNSLPAALGEVTPQPAHLM